MRDYIHMKVHTYMQQQHDILLIYIHTLDVYICMYVRMYVTYFVYMYQLLCFGRVCKVARDPTPHVLILQCVHCDLAARNILMTANGTLKVSDFGLARKLYYEVYHKNVTSTVSAVGWGDEGEEEGGRGGEGKGAMGRGNEGREGEEER